MVQRLLKCVMELDAHRGCAASRLGRALAAALLAAPSVPGASQTGSGDGSAVARGAPQLDVSPPAAERAAAAGDRVDDEDEDDSMKEAEEVERVDDVVGVDVARVLPPQPPPPPQRVHCVVRLHIRLRERPEASSWAGAMLAAGDRVQGRWVHDLRGHRWLCLDGAQGPTGFVREVRDDGARVLDIGGAG